MTTHRLSLESILDASKKIDTVFLNSPQYINEPLSKIVGCKLILKVEVVNPIRCFKGRGADYLVSKSEEEKLICASAGNFGQAMAYACRKSNKKLLVYASLNANPLKVERMRQLDAEVILFGNDFDEAKNEARRISTAQSIRFVEDGLDIETLAGAATIGLELVNQFTSIDEFLIPLGNGALLNGMARIIKSKQPTSKVIAIQAKGAPSMIESWREKKLISHSRIETIADGIGVRVPIKQALDDMEELVDDGLLVSEAAILEAMKLLHQHAGLVIEPSGAVGIAALLEHGSNFKNKTVATVLCGGNLTTTQIKEWL
jgi:threonine dehydratase